MYLYVMVKVFVLPCTCLSPRTLVWDIDKKLGLNSMELQQIVRSSLQFYFVKENKRWLFFISSIYELLCTSFVWLIIHIIQNVVFFETDTLKADPARILAYVVQLKHQVLPSWRQRYLVILTGNLTSRKVPHFYPKWAQARLCFLY